MAGEQYGIFSEDRINDDQHRSRGTQDPEAHGQDRLLSFFRIDPLVNKSKREYNLGHTSHDNEPQGDVLIPEDPFYVELVVVVRVPNDDQGENKKKDPEELVQFLPETLHLKVPDIYKVGHDLAQHDGKIISEPTIYEH